MLLFCVRSTPVLPLWHVKDPGHSAKSAGGELSENIRPQSSHLGEPLWTDSGIKKGISVCELISASKNKTKKGRRGINGHSPIILASDEEATTATT